MINPAFVFRSNLGQHLLIFYPFVNFGGLWIITARSKIFLCYGTVFRKLYTKKRKHYSLRYDCGILTSLSMQYSKTITSCLMKSRMNFLETYLDISTRGIKLKFKNRNQDFPATIFLQRNSTCFCKGPFFFNPCSMVPMEWRAVA